MMFPIFKQFLLREGGRNRDRKRDINLFHLSAIMDSCMWLSLVLNP